MKQIDLDRPARKVDKLSIEYFPLRLNWQLKVAAAQLGVTKSALVIEILKDAMEKEDNAK